MEKSPPDVSDPFISEVISGIGVFGKLSVSVHLVIEEGSKEPRPARTISAHFSPVYYATQEDVEKVFGKGRGREVVRKISKPSHHMGLRWTSHYPLVSS